MNPRYLARGNEVWDLRLNEVVIPDDGCILTADRMAYWMNVADQRSVAAEVAAAPGDMSALIMIEVDEWQQAEGLRVDDNQRWRLRHRLSTAVRHLVEECAKVADGWQWRKNVGEAEVAKEIATRIRALTPAALSVPVGGREDALRLSGDMLQAQHKLERRYQRLLATFSELQAAAQHVVDETDRIHDSDPWPTKYRAPYAAITKLRQLLATHYGLRALSPSPGGGGG